MRILIVDDETANCENLADILEEFGHEVIWRSDPVNARDEVESGGMMSCDLALLDFKMPGVNGLELSHSLKKCWPGLVTILTTAYANSEQFGERIADEFWKVLSKPLPIERLLDLINELTPTVLVVDDDELFCDTLESILSDNGIRCQLIHDCQTVDELLNSPEAADLDVAIVDWRLPDGTGNEVLKKLERLNQNVATIMVTGYPEQFNSVDRGQDQLKELMTKPIRPEQLIDAIKRLQLLRKTIS